MMYNYQNSSPFMYNCSLLNEYSLTNHFALNEPLSIGNSIQFFIKLIIRKILTFD